MDALVITTALEGIVTNVTEIVGAAAPIVLGVMATLAGVQIGFKLFKRFSKQAG